MCHVRVFEAPDHVGDRVGLSNVVKEPIAQAFARMRSGHEAGDVDELDRGWDPLLWLHDLGHPVEARIRDEGDSGMGFDRAEGVVVGGDTGGGEGVEQGGFPHVGESHHPAGDSHAVLPSSAAEARWGCRAIVRTRGTIG